MIITQHCDLFVLKPTKFLEPHFYKELQYFVKYFEFFLHLDFLNRYDITVCSIPQITFCNTCLITAHLCQQIRLIF